MHLEKKFAKQGVITPAVKKIALAEQADPELLASSVADGTLTILSHRKEFFCGIGSHTCVKVNANLGTSPDLCDLNDEKKKLCAAIDAGADAVMDLSTGGDLNAIRKEIISSSTVPVGSVPIYQAIVETIEAHGSFRPMTSDTLFQTIEKHAADGISFVTVHCGVTRKTLDLLKKSKRLTGIVSRGGAFLLSWMLLTGKENPLYEEYDRLLELARKYDLVLSLGDGLRPGSVADATDTLQMSELITLGDLARRAAEQDVQVFIEGPGHIPLHQVAENVRLAKTVCAGAPLYLLGPIVTDVAPGYDHITGAIGGAVAAMAGADFLCYLTPAEHLTLPGIDDVVQGVIASRIAGHAADIARGRAGARDWDDSFAKARYIRDWEEQERLSMDPARFKKLRTSHPIPPDKVCTMCGKYCALKVLSEALDISLPHF